MKQAVRLVNGLLGSLVVLIFTILVVCVVWQVFSRYVLGTPSTTTDEIARFLFMWIAFTGAAYTLGQKRHLAIDVISLWMGGRSLRNIRVLVLVIIGAFVSVVMLYGGWQLMAETLKTGQMTPALRIPMGYVYGAIPFSGLTMLFYCVVLIIELLDPNTPFEDEIVDTSTPMSPSSSSPAGQHK
ncbi:TRAP transporter small permease [Cohaesibacter celericrescens]|uniref:TRAP transporter small permease protein n=1 Tax=Cohaesibacter celericrescens TaxID=2067669 RepID=A0A2N5XTC9_9HYPH|nr:TRAP transporter small permease [Cohaesibacter celericrescens]PLW77786.1 TRAP transporter small permease [Cohaesibacter celericrescens]